MPAQSGNPGNAPTLRLLISTQPCKLISPRTDNLLLISTLPLTFNSVNVPTDVILGWADVSNVPVIKPPTLRFSEISTLALSETSPTTSNLELGSTVPIPTLSVL